MNDHQSVRRPEEKMMKSNTEIIAERLGWKPNLFWGFGVRGYPPGKRHSMKNLEPLPAYETDLNMVMGAVREIFRKMPYHKKEDFWEHLEISLGFPYQGHHTNMVIAFTKLTAKAVAAALAKFIEENPK